MIINWLYNCTIFTQPKTTEKFVNKNYNKFKLKSTNMGKIEIKKTKFAIVLIAFINFSYAQNPFYIGHSLVNFDMPHMVQQLAVSAGKTSNYGVQVINGSTLNYNYNNSGNAQGTPYTTALPGGDYNTLIITEAVPLQNHLTWSDTHGYANNFYTYAKNNNNNIPIRFYIYETWHCINSGIPSSGLPSGCSYDDSANSYTLWYPRLLLDFPLWSGIVTSVRNQNPNDTEIWMIPAGQAFYNLTTEINSGNVSGLTSFTDLFLDDIHLTNAGNYFIACVMYAVIYNESPVGLTNVIQDQYGNNLPNMPTTVQAQVMQQVAWDTVVNLSSWTGVQTLSVDGDFNAQTIFSIYPNPSKEQITVVLGDLHLNEVLEIYSSTGKLIKEVFVNNTKTITLNDLSSGLYFIRLKNYPDQTQKIVKL